MDGKQTKDWNKIFDELDKGLTVILTTPPPQHDPGAFGTRYDAVAAVNVANGDHMAEEEREGLTDFRREASLQLRHDLAVAFTGFEARHFCVTAPVCFWKASSPANARSCCVRTAPR